MIVESGVPKRRAGGFEQATNRIATAGEFLAEARKAHSSGAVHVGVSNACLSAIAAGDVISYALVGERSAGPSHNDAVQLLRDAGESGEIVDDLAWALREKNGGQYLEDWAGDLATVDDGITRAKHLLDRAWSLYLESLASRWAGDVPEDFDATRLTGYPSLSRPRPE